jgi:hypothetical protein
MLSLFRNNIKYIVWAIVLSFVAWGGGSFTTSRNSAASYAGSIRGERISYKEYLTTLRFYELLGQAQQRARENEAREPLEDEDIDPSVTPVAETTDKSAQTALPAKNIDEPTRDDSAQNVSEIEAISDENPELDDEDTTLPEAVSYEEIRSAAWQNLVLSREAKRDNIAVTDEDVRTEIKNLFGGNFFSPIFYERWVGNNFNGNARDFEEIVRKHILTARLRDGYLKDLPEEDRNSAWFNKLLTIMNEARVKDYTVKPN